MNAPKARKDRARAPEEEPFVPEFERGQTIPGTSFRVRGVLGRGAFGTVYDCEDGILQVPCAVKIVNRNLVDHPEIEHVMMWEARQTARINSDHVVKVRSVGRTAEVIPRLYINMFKLDGECLFTVLRAIGRLHPIEAIMYASHVAMGLVAAHAIGLVHCDIKPANIFLMRHYDPLTRSFVTRAVVLDLGVARVASTGASERSVGLRGTAITAPPEQYEGRVYPQSDVYALGVTFFMMLAGTHPLAPFNNLRDLLQAKLRPERIKRLRDVLPGIDPELDALVWRMIQPDYLDRPATMEEVLGCLSIIQEREEDRLVAEAILARGELKPKGRGAQTTPEPPEAMKKRMHAHYAASAREMPTVEPEIEPPSVEEILRGVALKARTYSDDAGPTDAARKRQVERYADGLTSHAALPNPRPKADQKSRGEPTGLETTDPAPDRRRAPTTHGVGPERHPPHAPRTAQAATHDVVAESSADRDFFLGKSTMPSAAAEPLGERNTTSAPSDAPPSVGARVTFVELSPPDRSFRDPARASTMAGLVLRLPLQVRLKVKWDESIPFRVGVAALAVLLFLVGVPLVMGRFGKGPFADRPPQATAIAPLVHAEAIAPAPARAAPPPSAAPSLPAIPSLLPLMPEAPVAANSSSPALPKSLRPAQPSFAHGKASTPQLLPAPTVPAASPPPTPPAPAAPTSPVVKHQDLLDAVNKPAAAPPLPSDITHNLQ